MADSRYIIELILKARDDSAAAFAKATGNLEAYERLQEKSNRNAREQAAEIKRLESNLGDLDKKQKELNKTSAAARQHEVSLIEAKKELEVASRKYAETIGKEGISRNDQLTKISELRKAQENYRDALQATNQELNKNTAGKRAAEMRRELVLSEQDAQLQRTRIELERERQAVLRENAEQNRKDGLARQASLREEANQRREILQQIRTQAEETKRTVGVSAPTDDQRKEIARLRQEYVALGGDGREAYRQISEGQKTNEEDLDRISRAYKGFTQSVEAATAARRRSLEAERIGGVEGQQLKITADLDTAEATQQAIAFKTLLAGIDHHLEVNADFDTAKATAEEAAFHARTVALKEALGSAVAFDVEAHIDKASIAKVEAERAVIGRPIHTEVKFNPDANVLAKLVFLKKEISNNIGGSIDESASRIAAFDNLLRGLMALLITIFLEPLLALAIAAGGALVALASSAIAAGAALGGALVAGISQAIPALGLLAIAASRIKGVFAAVQQANLLQQQQSYAGAKAANTQARSLDGVKSAQEGLASAQRNVLKAQEALTKARETARQKLEDLILTEKGASISAEEAQNALSKAIATGEGSLAVSKGQLGVGKADLSLSRTRAELKDRVAGGIEGSPEVEAAKEQLANARRAADQARRSLDQAKASAAEAATGTTAAAGKLEYLLSQMSKSERKLYENAIAFQKFWQGADGKEGWASKVTAPLIEGFANSIPRIQKILSSPAITNAAIGLSKSLSASFQRIFDAITSPKAINTLLKFVSEFQKNLKPVTDIVLNLGKAFVNIGLAANPALSLILEYISDISRNFANFVSSTKGKNYLADLFKEGVTALKAWMGLLGAIGRLFLAIVGPGGGAQSGVNLIELMTGAITKLAKEIEKPNSKINEFLHKIFETTEAIAKILGPVIADIAGALLRLFVEDGANAVKTLADVFVKVLVPSFETFIRVLQGALALFRGFIEVPFVPVLLSALAGVIGAWTVASRLFVFFKPVAGIIGGIGKAFIDMGIKSRLGAEMSIEALAKERKELSLLQKAQSAKAGLLGSGKKKGAATAAEGAGALALAGAPEAAGAGGLATGAGAAAGGISIGVAVGVVAAVAAIVALIAYAGKLDNVWRALRSEFEKTWGMMKDSIEDIVKQFDKLTRAVFGSNASFGKLLKVLGTIFAGALIGAIHAFFFTLRLAIGQIVGLISGIVSASISMVNSVVGAFQDIIGGIKRIFSGDPFGGIKQIFSGLAKLMLAPFKGVFDGIKGYVKGIGTYVLSAILDAGVAIISGAGWIADKLSKIPGVGKIFSGAKNAADEAVASLREYRAKLRQVQAEEDIADADAKRRAEGVTRGNKSYGQLKAEQAAARDKGKSPAQVANRRKKEKQEQTTNDQAGSFLTAFDENTIKMSEEITKKLSTFWAKLRTTTRRSMDLIVGYLRDMKVDGNRLIDRFVDLALADFSRLRVGTKNRLTAGPNSFVQVVKNAMQEAAKAVYDGAKYMNSALNDSLSALGGSKSIKISLEAPNIAKRAGGGWIGNAGERGRDAVHTVLGRGEAVLNWAHQKVVEPALQKTYGFGLHGLFKRTSGFHAGGPQDQTGFATGGFTGPDGSGEGFTPVWNIAQKKFGMTYFTGKNSHNYLTSTGNVSDHSWGGALDMGNGILTAGEDALNALFKQKMPQVVKQLIWRNVDQFNGYPIGGHEDHVHLAMHRKFAFNRGLMARLIARASRGLSISELLSGIGAPGGDGLNAEYIDRAIVKGKGALKEISQKVLDKIRSAANKLVDRENGTNNSGTSTASMEEINAAVGDLNKTFDSFHIGQQPASPPLSPESVVKLAQSVGLPGRLFEQIAHGESGYYPGIWGTDPGGTHGYGLWAITPEAWGGSKLLLDKLASLGGVQAMFNPVKNALMTKFMYDHAPSKTPGTPGFPWYGTRYVRAEGGFVGNDLKHLQHFADGGIIKGQEGAPVPIVGHAGEWILNKAQQSKLAKMLGSSIDAIKGTLGFTGGPTHFAGGGEISTKTFDADYAYKGPVVPPRGFAKVAKEIDRVWRVLNSLTTHKFEDEVDKFLKTLRKVTGDGGLLELMAAGIERTTGALSTRLELAQVGLKKIGTRLVKTKSFTLFERAINPEEIAKEEAHIQSILSARLQRMRNAIILSLRKINSQISKIRRENEGKTPDEDQIKTIDDQIEKLKTPNKKRIESLEKSKKAIDDQEGKKSDDDKKRMAELTKQISKLKKEDDKALTKSEKKKVKALEEERDRLKESIASYQGLVGERNKVLDLIAKTEDEIVSAEKARFEALSKAFEEGTNNALKRSKRNTIFADAKAQIGEILGRHDLARHGAANQLQALRESAKILQIRLSLAQANANKDPRLQGIADDLQEQVVNAQVAVIEKTAEILKASIETVTETFDKSEFWRGLQERRASIMERTGNISGAFAQRQTISQDRIASLNTERTGLADLVNLARAEGNVGVVEELTQKIADLDTTIAEEIVSQTEATNNFLKASADLISSVQDQQESFLKSALDIFSNLLDSFGSAVKSLSILESIGSSLRFQQGSTIAQTGAAQAALTAPQTIQIGEDAGVPIYTTQVSPWGVEASGILEILKGALAQGPEAYAQALADNSANISYLSQILGPDNPLITAITSMTDVATAIAENTKAIYDAKIAIVENTAGTAEFYRGLNERRATLRETAGDFAGAQALRLQNSTDKISAAQAEIGGLSQIRAEAILKGDSAAVIEELDKQIADLTLSIEEETSARKDLILSYRQAQSDRITGASSRATGLIGAAQSIIEKLGRLNPLGQIADANATKVVLTNERGQLITNTQAALSSNELSSGSAALVSAALAQFTAGSGAFAAWLTANASALAALQGQDAETVNKLIDALVGNTTALADNTSQLAQYTVDAITQAFDKSEFWRGLQERTATLQDRTGDRAGGQATRVAVNDQKLADLAIQRNALLAVKTQAALDGNTAMVDSLTQKIADLDTTIQEQTQAALELTLSYRQTQTSIITGEVSRSTGLLGSVASIFQKIGTITGQDTIPQQLSNAEAIKVALADARGNLITDANASVSEFTTTGAGSLISQLVAAFSTNDAGTFGSTLQLLAPAIAALEATMGDVEKTAFAGLIDAMVENTVATQDNTQQINELQGASQEPISWSTTAWQMFRQAQFTGAGASLYTLPQMETGGYVTKGGAFDLHAGEFVINAKGTNVPTAEGDINITVNEANKPLDVTALASRIAFEKRTRR